jgi:hypothetical protein
MRHRPSAVRQQQTEASSDMIRFVGGELACALPHCQLTSPKLCVTGLRITNTNWVPDMTHFLRITPFAAGLLFLAAEGGDASAAPILASATRASAFQSSSTSPVLVPLREDGGTSLTFHADLNQTVVITYNAECMVAASRGTWLSIKVLVDGTEAEPSSGTDFALCSAVDTDGKTWASAVRQSVLKMPYAGTHVVKIEGRLLAGSGSWRLDDSSLVVQPARGVFAARTDAFQSAANGPTKLPLLQNGDEELSFTTSVPNERLKITYNAECVVASASPVQNVETEIRIDSDFSVLDPYLTSLCNAVDATGKTWTGAAQQEVATIPLAGTHTAAVFAQMESGVGTWRVDDSSLVITKGVLASAHNLVSFSSSSTERVKVPILPDGGTALEFTTTKDNQQVMLTYNGWCALRGERDHYLGLRIEVDGTEAAPASGFDFALCSAVTANNYYYYHPGFRQSVITVPKSGVHKVRVFARVSGAVSSWALGPRSLVVE